MYHKGFGLRAQWQALSPPARHRGQALIAYLQSFTNTYGPASRLAGLLAELAGLPDLAGLCLGTRPDCLDAEKFALLARFPSRYVRLELGLQSASDATLARINRGHDAACFAWAVREAAAHGIGVTAHVMAGLPGEGAADFLATIDFINTLPVTGIKLHNTLVVAGAALETLYRHGDYLPLARETYIETACAAIARLRPDIVIERVNADPAPNELVAPAWAADKHGLRQGIEEKLAEEDIRQGCAWGEERQEDASGGRGE